MSRAPNPELAARIAHLRQQRGLTQREAGERIGVSTATWLRWEKSIHEPHARYRAAIAELLGVPLGELAPGPETTLDRLLRIEAKVDDQARVLQEINEGLNFLTGLLTSPDRESLQGFLDAIQGSEPAAKAEKKQAAKDRAQRGSRAA